MKKSKIVIGTRGSKLALWQAELVKSELKRLYPELEIELNRIKTTGDKVLDVPLAKVGGKGLFVKEIEEALLGHEVDIAVHSMKDVPTEFPDGLHLAVICKREDPRDALIVRSQPAPLCEARPGKSEVSPPRFAASPAMRSMAGERGRGKGGYRGVKRGRGGINNSLLYDLPYGAKIGTSSLRRSCQLLNIRPDLRIEQLRGNLDTRLKKLDEGQFDAIILAAAGIKRLGWAERITEILTPEISLPAIGQGAIGVECRIDNEFVNNLIAPLDHPETSTCVKAERAFLKWLEGGCQVPIAAYARIEHKGENSKLKLIMDGLVGSITGDKIVRGHIEGKPEEPEALGIKLAEDLLARGAREILEKVYG